MTTYGGCAATLNVWSKTKPNGHYQELPVEVKRFLRRRFVLSDEQIDALKCVTQPGWLNGERVVHIRIFDPTDLHDLGARPITSKEVRNDSDVGLFSGHISKDHSVHLTPLGRFETETS